MENNAIDWTPIIVALISSVGGIIGAYLAVRKGSQEQEIKNAQREQRQSDRLDSIEEKIGRLEKKVSSNGVVVIDDTILANAVSNASPSNVP